MKFFNDLSKGKFLQHPLHVMLVHFPLALFPASLLFDVLSCLKEDSLFALMSFYLLALACLGGYIAAFFGMLDLIQLPQDKMIWKKTIIHVSVNGLVLTSYTVIILLRMKAYPSAEIVSGMEAGLNAGLNLMMVIAAYYGGDLILRHKVGQIDQ